MWSSWWMLANKMPLPAELELGSLAEVRGTSSSNGCRAQNIHPVPWPWTWCFLSHQGQFSLLAAVTPHFSPWNALSGQGLRLKRPAGSQRRRVCTERNLSRVQITVSIKEPRDLPRVIFRAIVNIHPIGWFMKSKTPCTEGLVQSWHFQRAFLSPPRVPPLG